MGLELYNSDKNKLTSISSGNPLKTYHDGKNGSVAIQQIYVRNDDPELWYDNINITPRDTTGYDDTVGEYGTGFSVKLAYGAVMPLPHEWALVNSGATVYLPSDVGSAQQADTTTYYPVWVRISVPGNTNTQNKTDISLRLAAVERAVTG